MPELPSTRRVDLRSVGGRHSPAPNPRRATLHGLLAGVLVLMTGAADAGAQGGTSGNGAAVARPNVVFIVLDTTRADRMSYNGYSRVTTPYLDAFARDAVVYRNAHSVAPWTLPSHMSMFTGLLPGEHGAIWRLFSTPENMTLGDILKRSFRFADASRFLPHQLREAGYVTVGFSSNAWISRRTGFDIGFDHFYEMWKQSNLLRRAYDWVPPRLREYLSRWVTEELRTVSDLDIGEGGLVLTKLHEHVAANGDLRPPFFLFFNLIDPHFPYSPPMSWRYAFGGDVDLGEALARFRFDEMGIQAGERPVDLQRFAPFYDGEVAYLDFVVGRLLAWLREKGYYDETLIVIAADHGEHLGERGKFSHQFSVEEELLHIPMLVKYPRGADAGRVIENPLVSNIDIYETVLSAAIPGRREGRLPTSLDLRDMSRFDRAHLIAEYDYAMPYLRLSRERSVSFSIEENAVVRRVVYDRAGRHLFLQRDGEPPAPLAGGEESGRAAAAAVLSRYVENLEDGRLVITGGEMDEATRNRLRALGYVD